MFIKFKSDVDKFQFDLMNFNEATIRKRLSIAKKHFQHKDKTKSRNMKNNWRRNRRAIEKGLKKWHKSTKGKRFHRALARFNSLREKTNEDFIHLSYQKITDGLLSLSSIETHLLIELQYYEPDFEALQQYLFIVENYIEDSYDIKKELIESYFTGVMDYNLYQDMVEIIQLFLDPKMYLYTLRDKQNLSNDINKADESLRLNLEKIQNFNYNEVSELYEFIDSIQNHKPKVLT